MKSGQSSSPSAKALRINAEGVGNFSPGLLQPWEQGSKEQQNAESVGTQCELLESSE